MLYKATRELIVGHVSILMQKVNKEATDEFSMENTLRIYPANDQMH